MKTSSLASLALVPALLVLGACGNDSAASTTTTPSPTGTPVPTSVTSTDAGNGCVTVLPQDSAEAKAWEASALEPMFKVEGSFTAGKAFAVERLDAKKCAASSKNEPLMCPQPGRMSSLTLPGVGEFASGMGVRELRSMLALRSTDVEREVVRTQLDTGTANAGKVAGWLKECTEDGGTGVEVISCSATTPGCDFLVFSSTGWTAQERAKLVAQLRGA